MAYTGLTAKLTVKKEDKTESAIAYISNWSVDETRDAVEITQLGKGTKEIVPTLYYWSASAEGTADFADSSSQAALRTAMTEGTPIDVQFFLSEDANNYACLKGSAFVTAFSTNISAEDKGGVSISLTGEGNLELITTAPKPDEPTNPNPTDPSTGENG